MLVRFIARQLSIGLLAASPVFGANPMGEWKVVPAPKNGDALGICENEAEFVWSLNLQHDEIGVQKLRLRDFYHWHLESYRELPQFSVGKFKNFPRLTIAVFDGTLVGYNSGEWGGAVWWFSNDRKSHREVSRHQVTAFFERDGGIYALEGQSHMTSTVGTLVKFEVTPSGKWQAKPLAILPDEPGPYTWVGAKELLVVAGSNLIRLSLDGDRQTLHSSDSGFGRASSILVDGGGQIYVGAGGVIIRLTPQGNAYREEWLLPEPAPVECRDNIISTH